MSAVTCDKRGRGFLVVAMAAAIMLLGAGCTLDPLHARRAAATASAAQDRELDCPPVRSDTCALQSPYRALAETALAQSTPQRPLHFVNLLERGEASLLLRLHLIRSAQHSIDVQTFIFSEDDASALILDELVKAARRGVAVRVIVDQLFSLDDAQLYAALARAHVNFELRVYNPTFHKASTPPLEFAAGILCCFWRFNQRMHNKLLLIDGAIGIAGGRNYENRYYDWDNEFDYRDRDALVAGPVGGAMRASFDRFWADPHTVALSRLRDVAGDILDAGISASPYALHAYHDAARVAELSAKADDADFIRAHFSERSQRVGRVDYFSDAPGKPAAKYGDNSADHGSTRPLVALLRNAKNEVVLQTPYLVLSSAARHVFRELHRARPPVRVIVSTNSLAATDAFYVYALSYKYKKRYIKLGFEIHEFKPYPSEAPALIADYDKLGAEEKTTAVPTPRHVRKKYTSAPLKQPGVRIGLHAKSMVIDGAIAVIGSHNFDPRSEERNTEDGFIIYDASVATQLRQTILNDAAVENSWTIARRPRTHFFGRISSAIADLSTKLPLFDLWPFRYATSFEFNPHGRSGACTALPPGATGFYDCYTDVGDFPEVDLPSKTIYTRIVTAFGAGLLSVM